MPGPPQTQLPDHSEDDRIRPRSVHLLPGGSQLIVAYLNHGIVYVLFILQNGKLTLLQLLGYQDWDKFMVYG
jgi:hypothetical protein